MLPEGAVTLLLAGMLALLGDDDYRVREAASHWLVQAGASADWIVRAARTHPDAETRYLAIDIWRQRSAAIAECVKASDGGPLPWIDQLPDDFPDKKGTIAKWRYWGFGAPGKCGDKPDWLGDRAATRLFLADLIAQGWTIERVQTLVDRMADIEVGWRFRNTTPPRRPIPWRALFFWLW